MALPAGFEQLNLFDIQKEEEEQPIVKEPERLVRQDFSNLNDYRSLFEYFDHILKKILNQELADYPKNTEEARQAKIKIAKRVALEFNTTEKWVLKELKFDWHDSHESIPLWYYWLGTAKYCAINRVMFDKGWRPLVKYSTMPSPHGDTPLELYVNEKEPTTASQAKG